MEGNNIYITLCIYIYVNQTENFTAGKTKIVVISSYFSFDSGCCIHEPKMDFVYQSSVLSFLTAAWHLFVHKPGGTELKLLQFQLF